MTQTRETLATQVSSELVTAVRTLASSEGLQLETLVEEALSDLLQKRRQGTPRDWVMKEYLASHERYAPLYEKLAK